VGRAFSEHRRPKGAYGARRWRSRTAFRRARPPGVTVDGPPRSSPRAPAVLLYIHTGRPSTRTYRGKNVRWVERVEAAEGNGPPPRPAPRCGKVGPIHGRRPVRRASRTVGRRGRASSTAAGRETRSPSFLKEPDGTRPPRNVQPPLESPTAGSWPALDIRTPRRRPSAAGVPGSAIRRRRASASYRRTRRARASGLSAGRPPKELAGGARRNPVKSELVHPDLASPPRSAAEGTVTR